MKYLSSSKSFPPKTLLLIFLVYALFTTCSPFTEQWTLSSPNGSINITISNKKKSNNWLSSSKNIYYTIEFKGRNEKTLLVLPSLLGITRNDEQFVKDLTFVSREPVKKITDTCAIMSGKRTSFYKEANELILTFKNHNKVKIQLVLRAFNSGIAFQYRFPEDASHSYSILDEKLNIEFPDNYNKWLVPVKNQDADSKNIVSFFKLPALFEVSKHWLLISENGINHFSANSQLCSNTTNQNNYSIVNTRLNSHSSNTQGWKSPWRIFMIGSDFGSIVESAHSIDYLPLLKNTPGLSLANKLALPVIFKSEDTEQHADDGYIRQLNPSAAQIPKGIPSSWDETRFIEGDPASHIVLARRKENIWYIAGINSGDNRTFRFKLPFIERGKTMEMLCDGRAHSTNHLIFQLTGDDIIIPVLAKGGFIGKITLTN